MQTAFWEIFIHSRNVLRLLLEHVYDQTRFNNIETDVNLTLRIFTLEIEKENV